MPRTPQGNQQGFILALALLMMLFVGLVVITSTERTGQETRVSQSEVPIATLQAAAEAAIHHFRKRAYDSLKEPRSSSQAACAAIKEEAEGNLIAFLNKEGKGTDKNNAVLFYNENQKADTKVYWYLDQDAMTYCKDKDEQEIKVQSIAFAGSHVNPVAKIKLAANIQFQPDNNEGPGSNSSNWFQENGGILVSDKINCNGFIGEKGNGMGIGQGNRCGSMKTTINDDLIKAAEEYTLSRSSSENTFSISIPRKIAIETRGQGRDRKEVLVLGNHEIELNKIKEEITIIVEGSAEISIEANNPIIILNIINRDGANISFPTSTGANYFRGIIFSPNSNIEVRNGGRIQGLVVSESLNINNGGSLYFAEDIPDLGGTEDSIRFNPTSIIFFDY